VIGRAPTARKKRARSCRCVREESSYAQKSKHNSVFCRDLGDRKQRSMSVVTVAYALGLFSFAFCKDLLVELA
jgi:hypothetical protein